MTLIYTRAASKKKPRKPTAQQRQLQAEWEAILKKHATPAPRKRPTQIINPVVTDCAPRETRRIASLNEWVTGTVSSKPTPVYTGSAILGIGTLHKSNAVPVFSQDEAVEISKMRRG